MSYIIYNDFKKLIQLDNLNQIISSDTSLLSGVELIAQEESTSYLVQKYQLDKEFTDTTIWSSTSIYKGGNRIYLDSLAYDTGTSYNPGDLALVTGNVYICITPTAGGFDLSAWTLIGPQYKLYFITLPFQEFNLTTVYVKGQQVWYKDSVYTAQLPSITPGLYLAMTGNDYSHNNPINVLPDDPVSGLQYWGVGVPYSVAAGTLPTDATKWTFGDNRSAQLVQYCCDIALYHVHSRVAPRNIPDLRVKRYDESIKWLKMAGEGKITANLPLIQPKTGGRIRWGGNTKQINSY